MCVCVVCICALYVFVRGGGRVVLDPPRRDCMGSFFVYLNKDLGVV